MRRMRAFWRDLRGATALEFALISPALLTATLGALEVALVMYDYHAASEATRRGVRQALLGAPVATLSNLGNGSITCSGGGNGSVTCTPGSVHSADSFTAIVDEIRAMAPFVQASNVRVTYRASGVTVDAAGAFVTPLVTVSLTGVQHDFLALGLIPGLPGSMTYPGFESTRLAATAPAS